MIRLARVVSLAIVGMLASSPPSAEPRVKVLASQAQQGNPNAQAQLGFMYEHGRGVVANYDLAAHWYLCAAKQGHTTAQYLLGLMYTKGHGVQRDDMLAYQWLNVATARAPQRAKEHYARIRDAVARNLTAAQLTEAQRLAANFLPRNARTR